MKYPSTIEEMVQAMLRCEQTKGQSVYQHGQSVRCHFMDLLCLFEGGQPDKEWRLPDWIDDYKSQILTNLYPQDTFLRYAIYHDCGKPFCREVDGEGKIHFPNHAEVSRETYLKLTGDETVSNLIGWDMVIHTASAEDIADYLKVWSIQDAMTLVVAALSEVHSNARMFGGLESVSFKSKYKKICKRAKQICKHHFGEVKNAA